MKNSITTDRTGASGNSSARIKQAVSESAREMGVAFSDRFTLLRLIATSETTDLYLARDHSGEQGDSSPDGELVELKVLADDAAGDPRQVELFYLESEAAAKLAHSNIIMSGEASCSGRIHYSVIEHRPAARTLRALLEQKAWLDPEVATGITSQIAAALDYAHQNGFLHLNLRPESVLIEPGGAVVVTDFGIAAQEELAWAHGARSGRHTAQYLSAEQAAGERLDHRSDLYTLGVMLFEMLTDRPPFDSSDRDSIKRKHVTQAPLPPRIYCAGVPETLSAIVMGLLEKNPNSRIQSGAALLSLLDKLAGLQGIAGRAGGPAVVRRADGAAVADHAPKIKAPQVEAPPEPEPQPEMEARHETEARPEAESVEAAPVEAGPIEVVDARPAQVVAAAPVERPAESFVEIQNPLDLALDEAENAPVSRERELDPLDVHAPHEPDSPAPEKHTFKEQTPEKPALEVRIPERFEIPKSRMPEKSVVGSPERIVPKQVLPERVSPARAPRERYEPPVIAVIDPPLHHLHESTAALEPLTGRLEPAVPKLPAPSARSRPVNRMYALLLLAAVIVAVGMIALARSGKLSNLFRRSASDSSAVVTPAPTETPAPAATEPAAPAESQPDTQAKPPQNDARPAPESSAPAANDRNKSTVSRKARSARSYRSQPAVRSRTRRSVSRSQPRSRASNSTTRPRRVTRRP